MKYFKNNLEIAKFLLQIEKKAYGTVKKLKIDVEDKKSDTKKFDLVTNYDKTIEKLAIAELGKAFDNPKIVSEEFNDKVEAKGTYFVIDPIDGTLNFANGIDLWGIQMAYVVNDEIVASAIFNPKYGEYYAGKGMGAFRNGKRFFTEKKPLHHLLFNLGVKPTPFMKILPALKDICLEVRAFGVASMGLVFVAEGKLGVYVMETNAHPWDSFPGFLLGTEAGCVLGTAAGFNVMANNEEALKTICASIENTIEKQDTSSQTKKTKNAKTANVEKEKPMAKTNTEKKIIKTTTETSSTKKEKNQKKTETKNSKN